MKKRFLEAMDDDLNTAVSIAVLLEMVKEVNKVKEKVLKYIEKEYKDRKTINV